MGSAKTQDRRLAPEIEAEVLAILAGIFQENLPRPVNEYADRKGTRKMAEKGNAGSQIHLGHMYYFGDGGPRDYSEARIWCLKAAAFEVCEAQSILGRIYANGYGVRRNFGKAADWFRKAADQESASDQCALGVLFAHGAGVAQDDVEAATLFKRAASQGNPYAQCALGILHTFGAGVSQDLSEAVKWFQKSAEKGHAGAQAYLCIHYAHGAGVPQDREQATRWYWTCRQTDPTAARFALEAIASRQPKTQGLVDAAEVIQLALPLPAASSEGSTRRWSPLLARRSSTPYY
jgi:TPR repeat protein